MGTYVIVTGKVLAHAIQVRYSISVTMRLRSLDGLILLEWRANVT